jgi:hypothetical protein
MIDLVLAMFAMTFADDFDYSVFLQRKLVEGKKVK